MLQMSRAMCCYFERNFSNSCPLNDDSNALSNTYNLQYGKESTYPSDVFQFDNKRNVTEVSFIQYVKDSGMWHQ